MIDPALAILGNQLLFDDISALEGHRLQEEGNWLIRHNDHSVGIWGLDAVPDDRFDAASGEFV